jgi:hypothetical protein
LTSALDGGEWSASHPGSFTPRERAPGTHWIRGWVGPTAVLDAVVKRNIPSPRRESNPRTPIVQPVAQSYARGNIRVLHVSILKFLECRQEDKKPCDSVTLEITVCIPVTEAGAAISVCLSQLLSNPFLTLCHAKEKKLLKQLFTSLNTEVISQKDIFFTNYTI